VLAINEIKKNPHSGNRPNIAAVSFMSMDFMNTTISMETFTFYIHQKNDKPLVLAGLWSEWTVQETGEVLNTFSIVTTKGNKILTKIQKKTKIRRTKNALNFDTGIGGQVTYAN
jgi:hypothetical protein